MTTDGVPGTDPPASDQELYDELSVYTLAHVDPSFIHQHIVDAYGAQHADDRSKPIRLAFALAGLYLHLERGFSGKAVQQAHTRLARVKKDLPVFKPPAQRGSMTVADVLRAAPGPERDKAIRKWCVSVWEDWRESQAAVRQWVRNESGI